jgi:SanA protein
VSGTFSAKQTEVLIKRYTFEMKFLLLFCALGLGLLLSFIIITNVVFYVGTKQYIYNDIGDAPSAEVALIPGAAILQNGALSSIFLDRVDMAITLYEAGKVSKILVSGDNSTDSHNEVNPVRLYLIDEGIPAEDIFLDHAGFDTYSTMYRARDIFGVTSLIVTTQSFHLPRSVFIARRLGMEAYGADADRGDILFRNYVREMLANEKAVLDLMFNRKPKFLGEKVPILGDGRNEP